MATQSSLKHISQVLISVSDKAGIVEFASALHKHGVNILSTGGTARLLAEKDIPVTEIADYTGFPEMMDGRVKTLHPKIHGGILGRRGKDDDIMKSHDIPAIDMVVVNLYPFAQTIANESCSVEDAIENIDIGGPTMLRSSAKNHRDVTVVVDPHDYQRVLDEMAQHNGSVSFTTRQTLAKKVFEHTAHYDGLIASYMGSLENDGSRRQFSDTLNLQFHKAQDMRYGENPHQKAAFYREATVSESCVASAGQLQGKALSYNNIADTDTAFECVKEFDAPACVIVKHANPCGVAVNSDILSAYEQAFATDPTSSFGGIIAFNRKLDAQTAKAIIDRQFVEVIIAPEVADDAKSILASKKNVRVLVSGPINAIKPSVDYKRVTGGILVQDKDIHQINPSQLATATSRAPSEQELSDCLFAWKVCKYVKSNAIVYAGKNQTIGIGAGQMSRVYSAKIAQIKAADENLIVAGSVMASDAFFPFRDSVDLAHEAGVTAIIQPGGSIRDPEVIEAANEHNIAMLFTGIRHFKH